LAFSFFGCLDPLSEASIGFLTSTVFSSVATGFFYSTAAGFYLTFSTLDSSFLAVSVEAVFGLYSILDDPVSAAGTPSSLSFFDFLCLFFFLSASASSPFGVSSVSFLDC